MSTPRRGLTPRTLAAYAVVSLGLLVSSPTHAHAQYEIRGIVADSSGAVVNGAMVVALSRPDSVLKKFALSGGDGGFRLNRLTAGEYILQITLVGHQTVRQDFEISDADIDAGTVTIGVLAIEMEALVVSVDHVPFVNRRDTLDYNALAFETPPQATVEDLLARLPGVEVADDGSIKAQGEDVKNVLVEGKEFFGSDPTIATRNLPADAVERVQIYDKQSDMAEFTGIADGEEERTINLDLKEGAENSYFGNVLGSLGGGAAGSSVTALPGNEGLRYNESLSLNKFSPTNQLAVLAGMNNVNQTGFGWGESAGGGGGGRGGGSAIQLGGRGNSGFTESLSLGFNASHDFGDDDWFRSSYFFSELDNTQSREVQQQLLLGSAVSSLSDQDSHQTARNVNHRFNVNAQKKISDGHDLRLRGDLTLGSSEQASVGTQQTTATDGRVLNTAVSNYGGDSDQFSGNARLTWRKRLSESGRSIVAEAWANISEPEQFTTLTSTIGSYGRGDVLTNAEISQEQSQTGRTLGYSQRLALTQPFGEGRVLELFAQRSATEEDRDESVYDIVEGGTQVFNSALSSAFERTYSYLRGGFRLSRNNDKTRFVLGLQVQGSDLDGIILDRDETITNGYTHVLPSADYRIQFDQGKNLSIRYTTSTREPSLTQLQPYANNTNPLNVYVGNPNLTPEYTHRLRADYRFFDQFTFLNFFTFGQVSYTNDEIVQARTVDENALQTRTPVNADNGWSANGGATLGTPIRRIGASINVSYNATYSTGTEFVNQVENVSRILRHSVDASLENRDKAAFDVRVGGRFTFNNVDYSINQEFAQDYLNRTLYANGTLYYGDGWTLASSLNYQFFDQEIFGPGQNVALLQASVSRFVMDERVQVRLVGMDLLNQNQGVTLSNTSAYIQEERVQSLGRYLMVSVAYQLGPQRGGRGGPSAPPRRLR